MSGCAHLIVVSAWRNFGLGFLCGSMTTAAFGSVAVALALRAQRLDPRPW